MLPQGGVQLLVLCTAAGSFELADQHMGMEDVAEVVVVLQELDHLRPLKG